MKSGWNMPDGVYTTPEDKPVRCECCGDLMDLDREVEYMLLADASFICEECEEFMKEDEDEN